MQITWYGHSCFLLTAENGYSILTDPCGAGTSYGLHDIVCDAVTISHDHPNHNCLSSVAGTPLVIHTAGEHKAGDLTVVGFDSCHDDAEGTKRGKNLIFQFVIDGLNVLHLGDLGHMLSDELIAKIGPVDVLLVPIGGVVTIDAQTATKLADALHTKVLIPMHYTTPALHFNIEGLEPLLAANASRRVHSLNSNTAALTRESLGENRLLILDYKH